MQLVENRKPQFFYGYVVVAVAFCVMLVAWGTFYSFGIFFMPLLSEFGWTRAATSGAFSLSFIINGLLSLVMGRLNDRFGPRLVITVCGVALGLGYLLMSQISTIWQLYLLYGVLIAIGMGASFVPLLSITARWFVKRRGLMTGVVVSGIGVGAIIMPLIARWLISSYGWRVSYSIIGMISLILIILAAQFLKRDPVQMGQLAYGEDELTAASSSLQARGRTLRESMRTRQFWMVSLIFFFFLFSLQSVMVHIVPHALELGVSGAIAASILAVIGVVSIAGKVVMGSASDRIGNRPAFIIGFVILVVSFLWLVVAKEVRMLYLFAVLFGFAYGTLAAIASPIVAELFGLDSHGVIFGASNLVGTIGGSVGPFLVGYTFDIFGSYQAAFGICAALSVMGIILSSLLRPANGLLPAPGRL